MKKLLVIGSVVLLSGCFHSNEPTNNEEAGIELGQSLFDKNCIGCHGVGAQGIVKDWRKSVADGKFPPPPLNGTAHAWHHPQKQLLQSINDGGTKIGGQMPAFRDKFNEDEKQALLDYIYSLWPKEIQDKYDSRFNK
jgi:mono/diheme cytochrome c family protein